MIIADGKTIGHISSAKRQNNWHETQIVIGEKKYWGKGYGSRSIKLLIRKAKLLGISRRTLGSKISKYPNIAISLFKIWGKSFKMLII